MQKHKHYIYVIQLRAPSKPCEIENNVGTVFLEVFLDWTYLRFPVYIYIRKRPGSPHPFSELPGAGMFSSKTLPKAPASRYLGFQSCCQKRRRTTGRNLDLSPRRHIFGSRFGEWLFITIYDLINWVYTCPKNPPRMCHFIYVLTPLDCIIQPCYSDNSSIAPASFVSKDFHESSSSSSDSSTTTVDFSCKGHGPKFWTYI